MLRRRLLPIALLALASCSCGARALPPQPAATASAPAPAAALTPAAIDAAIRAAWQKEGLQPTPTVDDARFLRRAYLDITGVIPPVEAVTTFLADGAPDKRAKLVDALLAGPRYAEHWTNVWDRVLLGREVKGKLVDRAAFRAWLRDELARGAGYDRLVYDLITASGLSGSGESDDDDEPHVGGYAQGVNGAVNWLVRYRDTPQDLAGITSKVFLGVQIQCAQCHDHKTEKWKTDDFRRFTACFAETRAEPIDPPGMGRLRRVEVADADEVVLRKRKKDPELRAIAEAAPAALDGTDFSKSKNRRQALAAWITSPQNPWFARALVNRIWARFLGRGFVDPVTDFRPGNPVVLPEVLDAMARDFVAGGYDLRRLIRLIAATEVYQRAAAPPGKDAATENKLWARFHVEPLAAGELFDSLAIATRLEATLDRRANGRTVEDVRRQMDRQAGFLFDVDEESDSGDFDGSIPQALFLMNGNFSNNNARAAPGSALAEVLDLPGGDAEKITSLYLRALSRRPSPEEIATWAGYVGGGKRVKKLAYEDLFWALLNSSEFTFNH